MIRRPLRSIAVLSVVISGLLVPYATTPAGATANNYGAGPYGSCTYDGVCSVTISSNGTVNVDVTPTSTTKCTIQSDTVSVMTDSSAGYTLSIIDGDTSNSMSGSNGGTVTAVSGTRSAPVALSANTWGYRADGAGSFGAGPTSAASNIAIPSTTFAAVPLSSGTADTLVSRGSAADPAVNTSVWFGFCANTSIPAGTYTDSVTYTAIAN